MGECSKVVEDYEHIVVKECNPSLKSLALRESKTTNITFVKVEESKVMSTSRE
jgi:hypothetical protein